MVVLAVREEVFGGGVEVDVVFLVVGVCGWREDRFGKLEFCLFTICKSSKELILFISINFTLTRVFVIKKGGTTAWQGNK